MHYDRSFFPSTEKSLGVAPGEKMMPLGKQLDSHNHRKEKQACGFAGSVSNREVKRWAPRGSR
jgi:hypothetical protein